MKHADPNEVFEQLKARVAQEKMPVDQVYYDLAARLAPSDKEFMPRILARLANPEQIKIVAALPDPDVKPSSGRSLEISDSFAEKLKMDKALVEKHIRALFEKGLVFPTKKGPTMARSLYQLHDSALSNPKYDEELGSMYYDLWGVLEGPKVKPSHADLPEKGSEFRVIPRWPSIKDVKGVEAFEDTHAILRSHEVMALIPCGCKRSHTDRWCGVPEDSCLTFDRTAQYNLDRGIGKRLTYDEAVTVLEGFDKLPTVHLTVNQREVGQLLCNCHHCCCIIMRPAAKSRFQVEVDPAKCKGCKVCVERCQFQAVKMKQYDGIEGERAFADPEICRGCGSCVITCRAGARSMKLVRGSEHVPESLSIY